MVSKQLTKCKVDSGYTHKKVLDQYTPGSEKYFLPVPKKGASKYHTVPWA